MKQIEVCDIEQHDHGYPPDDAVGALAWLTEQLAKIPQEYMPSAKVEFLSVGGYEGEHHGRINIYYERPLTAEEAAAANVQHRREAAYRDAQERELLAKLLAKHGAQ